MDRQSVAATGYSTGYFLYVSNFLSLPQQLFSCFHFYFHSCLKKVNAEHCLLELSRAQYLDIGYNAFTFRYRMDRRSVDALACVLYVSNFLSLSE